MKDFDLAKKLKTAGVPERTEEYWDAFPRQVLGRLRKVSATREPLQRWRPLLAWGLGAAIACVMIGFAIGNWHGRSGSEAFALLQNEKMIREILTMFPNRVRAIEQDERGIRLVLSEHADVPDSPPLWIKICDGNNCRAVVTFSGQALQIAKESVEVLADAQGQVMLVGNRLFWSSADPNRAAEHLRIQARPLAFAM